MFKRIKAFFESMAYAGLKPSAPGQSKEQEKPATGFALLRERIDKFVSGPASSDPLYLTNRTLWQKIRPILVISLPVLVLLGGLGLGMIDYFGWNKGVTQPPPSISNAEIAKKMLPVLNQQ